DPSKQEGVSRQSSILKPTKQRQPLQCVASHPSSSESSPTVRIERRVSFAKNRRIREFCNEAEQGTVWDDTYEEHDSNSTKSNSSLGHDQQVIINVPCQDKENFPIQLFIPPENVGCAEVTNDAPDLNEDDDVSLGSQMDDSIANFQLGPKISNGDNLTYPNATILCNDGMDETNLVPSEIIPRWNDDDSSPNHGANPSLIVPDKTVSVDVTENLTSAAIVLGQEKTKFFCDKSMNITETVPVHQNIICALNQGVRPELQDKMSIHSNIHTSCLAPTPPTDDLISLDYVGLTQPAQDRTKIFSSSSMDVTETIPVRGFHCNSQTKNPFTTNLPLSNNSISHLGNVHDGATQIFHDESMDLTSRVVTLPPVTKPNFILRNMGASIHAENPENNVSLYEGLETKNRPAAPSTTQIYLDDSMELTSGIPVRQLNLERQSTQVCPANKKSIIGESISTDTLNNQEKTIYMNKSMTMTVAVPANQHFQGVSSSVKGSSMCGKTQIYLDDSMELTSGVPVLHPCLKVSSQPESDGTMKNDSESKNSDENYNISSNRVKNSSKLIDESVQVTLQKRDENGECSLAEINLTSKALSKECLNHENLRERNCFGNVTPPGSNVQVLSDDSMELTSAISKPIDNITRISTRPFLSDMSRVIGNVTLPLSVTQSMSTNNELSNYTSKTMCMTMPVPPHKNFEDVNHVKSLNEGKTQIFQNMSMDITSKIATLPTLSKPMVSCPVDQQLDHLIYDTNNSDHGISNVIQKTHISSMTQIYQNDSMELTSAVSALRPKNRDLSAQNVMDNMQKNISNVSESILLDQCTNPYLPGKPRFRDDLENQKLIPTRKNCLEAAQSSNSCTGITQTFQNISMDLASKASTFPARLNHSCTGITQKFQNISMDLTSKLPILPTMARSDEEHSRKVEEGQNNGHSSQSYVSNNTKSKSPTSPSAHVPQNEFKNLNPSLPLSSNNIGGDSTQSRLDIKDSIMDNASMESTEIPLTQGYEKNATQSRSVKDGATTIFHDEPMDFTSRIPTLPTLVKPIPSISQNGEPEKMDTYPSKNFDLVNGKITSKSSVYGMPEMSQNDLMELSSGLPQSQDDISDRIIGCSPTAPSESRALQNERHNTQNAVNFSHKSVDELLNRLRSSHHQSLYDCNKSLANNSPDLNADSSITPRYSKISKKFNESNNVSSISNHYHAQNSLNHSSHVSRGSNHESFSRFGIEEKSFHRITSDELNTLCASMNLPNHRYDRNENTVTSHSIIPSCNDIQVLRDSLEKNRVFLQNSAVGSHAFTAINEMPRSPEKTSQIIDVRDNFVTHNVSDLGNVSATAPKNLSPVMDSSRLCDSITNKSLLSSHHSQIMPTQGEEKFETSGIECFEQTEKMSVPRESFFKNVKTPEQYPEQAVRLGKKFTPSLRNPLHVLETSHAPENSELNCGKVSNTSFTRGVSLNNLNAISSIAVEKSMNETAGIIGSDPESEAENKGISASQPTSSKRPSDSEVQVYHDSMSAEDDSPTSTSKRRKSCESCVAVETPDLLTNPTNIQANPDKENVPLSRENSLTRIPSENTDTLIATMGFKTELSYPLIINEKTIIKISSKCTMNKTNVVSSDVSYEKQIEVSRTRSINMNPSLENNRPSSCVNDGKDTTLDDKLVKDVLDLEPNSEKGIEGNISKQSKTNEGNAKCTADEVFSINNDLQDETKIIEEHVDMQDTRINEEIGNLVEECDILNDESLPKNMDSILSQSPEDLEEIEPPSFLCEDSGLENCHENGEEVHQDVSKSAEDVKSETGSPCSKVNRTYDLVDNVEVSIEKCLELPSVLDSSNDTSEKDRISTELDETKENDKDTEPQKDHEDIKPEEVEPEVLLTPFQSLLEKLKTLEMRDDCIWYIRGMCAKMIAIDFITKSFVVIIRLNEFEKECTKDIDRIEFTSRLRDDCKNVLMRIAHDLLLAKLTSYDFGQYKLYEDILPLLELISSEVISVMSFIFDLERLNALNLMDIKRNRVQFTISSKRANFILKICLVVKVFTEIGPDDIDVTCILGNIRENDIKKLIVNVKKDYKFLSRYMKDIKDYATLMEETMFLNKQ
ncbi:hypothetical protein QAD02_001808, partial [Eretmocerus hayati]